MVTDARAIKALAHPARLTVVDELYSGRVLTSSELAEIAGLTPSAMSYHLRALERWGVVERAEARSDGRERPWRASAKDFHIRTDTAATGRPASPSARAAAAAVALQYIDRLREGLSRWLAISERDPWHDVGRISNSVHRLTHDEALQLANEIDAVLDRYRAQRDARAHLPGARRTAVFFTLYPVEPPTDT